MVTHPKYLAPGDKARTRSQPSRGPSSTPLGDPWARPAARAHYPSMVRMSSLPVPSTLSVPLSPASPSPAPGVGGGGAWHRRA